MIPHPAKKQKGGEDAFFISKDSQTIGVADGVGGWEALGVDSGLYSRSLMCAAAEHAEATCAAAQPISPLETLKAAHDRCLAIPGSSTACVLTLRDRRIEAVNLGDSGFIIVRNGRVVYKTREQQHYWNCPFQLGSSRDSPDDAARIFVDNVQDGDVLVLATDGVFDNLFAEAIGQLVQSMSQSTASDLAARIAEEASRIANDNTLLTPFQEGARKNGQLWRGGKLDDITVVCAQVRASPVSTEEPLVEAPISNSSLVPQQPKAANRFVRKASSQRIRE